MNDPRDSVTKGSELRGRGALLRWAGWFAVANAALYGLVGVRFLLAYPFPADALGLSYAALATVGHFASLGLLVTLPALLLVVLWPRAFVARVAAVPLAALGLVLLVLDSNVFAANHYHLSALTVAIFAPSTWVFVAVMGLVALVFETLLAGLVARHVAARPSRGGVLLGVLLAATWLASQGIHAWADAIGYRSVTQLTRYLPAYFPFHAKRKLAHYGIVDAAEVERQTVLQRAGAGSDGQLNYPLAPLRCEAADGAPLNVLMVLIDALRPDATDPVLMPNLARVRAAGQDFANHSSGGNSSRAGLFSFFYGLPSTYMDAFYGVQRPPVLMDEFRARGYDFGLFAAPGFGAPADLDRTTFAGIPGLPGERRDLREIGRNRAVTDEWISWLGSHDSARPFFGFLYYDPPMGDMSADPDPALPMSDRFAASEPAKRAWAQYRRAAQMVDGELGRVDAALRERGLTDRTLLIVFSDHGYEFDDYGTGYIGHASDYTPAQTRATLVLRWPGRAQARYAHRTSHHDVSVTLLQDLFHCANPPADYGVGRNLFAGVDWQSIIAGSYDSHAIMQPDRVIVANAGGYVEVLGPDNRPLADTTLDPALVEQAMADMRRFYR